jgi:protein-tyrosine phosphatase
MYRYKNIWPYDFARVRLSHPADDESDYINASYVQPRGSSRRYIATQGPLDATYRDFWTLVWEQDVRVIVMLTKQYEGGMIKCGNYWQDEHYGPLHVLLDSQTGGEDAAHPSQVSGFDFGMARAADKPKSHESSANHESVNIRREFILSNDDDKHAGSRRVVQIQCVNWPDFDVPESPEVLLGVIKDVDQAVDEVVPPHRRGSVQGIKDKDGDRCEQSPVLVHCSAGVGRTGSFIVVDSIIDALHREFEAATSAGVEYEPQHDQPAHKMPSGAITAAALEDRSASFDGHSQHGAQSEASGRYGSGKRNVSFSVPPPLKSAVPSEGAAQATQATHAKQGQGASMADAHSSGSSSTTLIQSPSPRYASRQNTAERLGTQADSRAARHAARIVAEREEGDDGMDIDEPAGPTDTSAQYSSRNAEGQVEASPRQRSSFSNVNPKVPDPWSYRDQEGSVGDDQSETGSSAGGQSGSVGRRPSLASLGGSDRNSQEQ